MSTDADADRSHALNAPWALENLEEKNLLAYHDRGRPFSGRVGHTCSKTKQAPSCFAWGVSATPGALLADIDEPLMFETKFSFDYFTPHSRDGLEANTCSKYDDTVQLETVDSSYESSTLRVKFCSYNACSRRLSIICRKGRKINRRYSQGGSEEFIDSNHPTNMVVVFEDSSHDLSELSPNWGFQADSGTPTIEEEGHRITVAYMKHVWTHLVTNWNNLLEVATAHNLRLVSNFRIPRCSI
jgi:hypothetical protein